MEMVQKELCRILEVFFPSYMGVSVSNAQFVPDSSFLNEGSGFSNFVEGKLDH